MEYAPSPPLNQVTHIRHLGYACVLTVFSGDLKETFLYHDISKIKNMNNNGIAQWLEHWAQD